MRKASSIIRNINARFEVLGKNGYNGEQDGSRVLFSDPHYFVNKKDADLMYPEGIPLYVEIHYAHYRPGQGWKVVFAWWDNQGDKTNPIIGY